MQIACATISHMTSPHYSANAVPLMISGIHFFMYFCLSQVNKIIYIILVYITSSSFFKLEMDSQVHCIVLMKSALHILSYAYRNIHFSKSYIFGST